MKRTLTALTLAAATAISAPAMAGGSVSFTYEAQNSDEANAIRAGLTLYQIVKDVETNGHITQNGMNNIAALAQGGHGNLGVIHQEGNNHNASLHQVGNHQSCGIFQFGDGASNHVTQSSNGAACISIGAGF
ncbi:MAG: curlin [Rhodobacteraceae bacterium]|nr:curlin [Paracoccaceae bacterium]